MARDGGRTCGCDPKIDHVCESHAAHVDTSETEFIDAHAGRVVVSGPDDEGRFRIQVEGGATLDEPQIAHVQRFVLEDIIHELERRLAARAG